MNARRCEVPTCPKPPMPRSYICAAHYARKRAGDLRAHVPVRSTHGALLQPRLPLAPLRARAASNIGLSRELQVSHKSVLRWKVAGVTLLSAEKACDALGLHPTEVWGDEYLYAASCPLALVAAQVVA